MNTIHETAIIDSDVVLGENNFIGANVILESPLRIGNNNYIGHNTIIGTAAEDAKNLDSISIRSDYSVGVIIGDNNVVRELSIIHSGINTPTTIANKCWIHSQCHIDHDCCILDNVILAPMVALAGTVSISSYAQIGMNATVHQNTIIGGYSMTSMNATVVDNISPCSLVIGSPAKSVGVNYKKLEQLVMDYNIISELDDYINNNRESLPILLPKILLHEFVIYMEKIK